jgi:hypothetical protein
MSFASGLNYRKNSFRFALCISVCLSLPAFAQQKTDPFATNAISPSLPSALPNAPTPTSTYTPAPTVSATPAPPPPTEPVAQPAPLPVQQVETTPLVKTAEKPSSPSFWDKLESLFSSEETSPPTPPKVHLPLDPIEEEPVSEEPQTSAPLTVEQPVPTPMPVETVEEVAPPAPVEEPKVVAQPEVKNTPLAVTPKKTIIKPQYKPTAKPVVQESPAPKTKTVKEVERITQPQQLEKDPFATNASAPELPTSLPQPLQDQPQLTVQTPPTPESAPKVLPETKKNGESIVEQAPTQPVETPVIVQQPAPAVQATPPQELTKTAPIEEESSTSFFDRLSNLFSSEPEPQPIEDVEYIEGVPPIELASPSDMPKSAKPPRVQVQNAPPITPIKPEPQPVSNVAPQESVKNNPTPNMQQILQIQEMTKSSATKAEPFDTTSVAPTTPVAIPQPPAPVIRSISKPKKVTAPVIEEVRAATPSTRVERPTQRPYLPKSSVHANFEEKDDSWFGKISSFFTDPFGNDDKADEPASMYNKPKQESPTLAPKQTKKQEEEVAPTAEEKPTDPRLINAQLGLGRNILLGQGDDDLSKKAKCLTKNRGTVAFCLTPTVWPVRIAKYFDISSHLYRGAQGIVQYDGNIATRLYTLFETDGFDQIVNYYEKTFGPATTHFVRKTRTIKKGIVDNPTYIWRKSNPNEGLTEIFELRKFADTRGSIPDLKHGSMRVFFDGSREIFTLTSDLDYMNLK